MSYIFSLGVLAFLARKRLKSFLKSFNTSDNLKVRD